MYTIVTEMITRIMQAIVRLLNFTLFWKKENRPVETIPRIPAKRNALFSWSLSWLRKRDSAVTENVAMNVPMKNPMVNIRATCICSSGLTLRAAKSERSIPEGNTYFLVLVESFGVVVAGF